MRITIAQLNPVIGDIEGNLNKALIAINKSQNHSSDLVVFPELYITGYPPRDLLERSGFIDRCEEAINAIKTASLEFPETGILIGCPWRNEKIVGKRLENSAILIYQGETLLIQDKCLLPTYDVFDESRYFDPAMEIFTIPFKDEVLGISICEDMWNDPDMWLNRKYDHDPIDELAAKGATIMLNLSASPYHVGKEQTRLKIIKNHAKKHNCPFLFVNQVGANDELIFDGGSMFVNKTGHLIKLLPSFEEKVETFNTENETSEEVQSNKIQIKQVHDALVLGISDYFKKCGFSKAVIGLSGGIDSAVTCALAQEAIGRENIIGVTMPSMYSSTGSVEDSRKLAQNLGIDFKIVPIAEIYHSYMATLKDHFKETEPDVTEENIQARIRGNILMAFSNKFGNLVLSTGNKSELAVGYCTLYGDMAGGLAVISDVPKTMVYELARYMNREAEVIPWATINKPPSAELKPDQFDQDSLPPYEVLDELLNYYVDQGYSVKDMVKLDHDPETISWVIRAVDNNEYKRRQAAPGLRITSKAFGMGRRLPIAAKYNG